MLWLPLIEGKGQKGKLLAEIQNDHTCFACLADSALTATASPFVESTASKISPEDLNKIDNLHYLYRKFNLGGGNF